MKKSEKKPKQEKTSGDAKGKASLDQNGKGKSPKYAQAEKESNELQKDTGKKKKPK